MNRKFFGAVIVILLSFVAHSQQTQFFTDPEAAYRKGLELFDEKNYLSARGEFERIYTQQTGATYHGNEVLMQNLEYYIAVCAVEANEKDAELLLLNYFKKYHETDKRRLVSFYLGKLYYQASNYGDAITYFTKVDVNDLDQAQLYDYKFMLAYSYFTRKKFTEAKPLFASIKEIKDKYYYPSNYYYAFICFYTKEYDAALKSFLLVEDSKMYSAAVPYYVAQIYYMKKDYEKVISYINANLQKPGVLYKDEMGFLLGQTYFQKNEYTSALPLLQATVAKSSKATKGDIYMLAYCQYKTGDYTRAIENFKQLNLLNEEMGQNATYVLADCYLKTNQKDKARSAFQSAASMDFNPSIKENSLFNYGKLSFELGFSSDAIKTLEAYLEKYPSGEHVTEANELLATALVQTKDYERAYHIMETLKSTNPMIQEAYQKVTYFRSIELYNDNKYEDALALCDKSLKNPVNIDLQAYALYLKGEILYAKGSYDDAIQDYGQFVQLATLPLEKKGEASKFRANYNIGYSYFKKKDYEDAVVYFSLALDESKTTVDAKGKKALLPDLAMRYADCQFVTKNYGKAIDGYNRIVENKWSGADYAQYRKGIILGLQNRSTDKIEAMQSLLKEFPGSKYCDQANYEIGETYLLMGDNGNARLAYQNIINNYNSSPLQPRSYLKTAVIDYNSGNKEQAIQDYKQVVKKFPDAKEAKEAMNALKDIYVETGKADEFFTYAKNNSGIQISASEQDSLTWQSAGTAFDNDDCQRGLSLSQTYLEKFPAGYFSNEAHWLRAQCAVKSRDFASAYTDFEGIIRNKYSKYYEQSLLKASGIAYYELKDYNKAMALYQQLYVASSSASNTYTSMLGLLRTSVKLGNNDATIEYADQLINSGTAKEADMQEAYYEKGKAYTAKGNKDFAMASFNHVTELPVSERAVEAKYMVAKLLYEQQQYKASLDTCFKLKDRYSSYEYWMAKTFVLIADNYYAQGNAFQAKATLESIIQNYQGDNTLLEEARAKLEKIRSEEINKSRIMQPSSGDTLQMETDSIKTK